MTYDLEVLAKITATCIISVCVISSLVSVVFLSYVEKKENAKTSVKKDY